MKASTVAALERINRDFYHRRALQFSETRKRPWPGWQLVLDLARGHLGPDRISVLDLGCGNGRFLGELDPASLGANVAIAYLGIDASVPLLGLAAGRTPAPGLVTRRLSAGDLVRRPLAELDPSARFDLIVNFGLMHHVPSEAARRRVLESGCERLRAGGILAVSFWQFGDKSRFESRFLSWRDRPETGVEPEDLEAGDHLLAWGDDGAARYCHFTRPAEAAELVERLGLEVLSSFRADGGSNDLNLYWVLRKPRP